MNENKLIVTICIIGLLITGVLSTAVLVKSQPNVNVNVSVPTAEKSAASGSSDFTGGGTTHFSDDIQVADQLTVLDDAVITDQICYGGICYDSIEGDCDDMTGLADGGTSTSSLFAVINPWGEDVYIPQGGFILSVTGATTTVDISCGTTSSATLLADPGNENLVNDVSVSTSTSIITYNTAGTVTIGDSLFTDPGTNSEDMIVWETGRYIGCYAAETGTTGGLLNANSTFDCTYQIRSFK